MSAYTFVVEGCRLVDTTGEFAIWLNPLPYNDRELVVGYADGRKLYGFSFVIRVTDGVFQIVIGLGGRDHPFDDSLVGRTRPLLEAAVPSIVRLPSLGEERSLGKSIILLGPANLIELALYSPREPQVGPLTELARVEG